MAGMAPQTPPLGYPVVSSLLTTSAPLPELVVGPWYELGRKSPLSSWVAPAAKVALSVPDQDAHSREREGGINITGWRFRNLVGLKGIHKCRAVGKTFACAGTAPSASAPCWLVSREHF